MQRCSEKAFAMCPTRHLCGSIKDATFTDNSECASFNKSVDDRSMTNADRIRAMSDGELAKWLDNFFWGNKKVNLLDIFKWLQQPAEKPKEDDR